MSTEIHDEPAVRNVVAALGTTARERRGSMDLLVFGATRLFGWSRVLQAWSGFRADYHPDQANAQGDRDGKLQVLMTAYMRAVSIFGTRTQWRAHLAPLIAVPPLAHTQATQSRTVSAPDVSAPNSSSFQLSRITS